MSELLKTIAGVNGTITAQNGVLILESGQTIDLSEYLPVEEKLKCAGRCECKQPVTHVDNKGYAYCTQHGLERRGWRPCRQLRKWEIAELKAGRQISWISERKPKV